MAQPLTNMLPAQKLELLNQVFRSVLEDANKAIRAHGGDFNTLPMEDAFSELESKLDVLDTEYGAFIDYIDAQTYAARGWDMAPGAAQLGVVRSARA